MFDEVKKEMISLSEVVHKFAFDIVFAPLQEQMSRLHEMEVSRVRSSQIWCNFESSGRSIL